jgi:hypothetical protein
MNSNFKAVLLTILTLSVFTIAVVELSGVSNTAIFNKYGSGKKEEEEKPRMELVNQIPRTKMQLIETAHDFGDVKEGEVVKHVFKVKNVGTNPLMISKTDVSCGCTATDFTHEPIPPNGEGQITVQFNTKGKEGIQKKNILIHSNGEVEAVSISIAANVK